MVAAPESPVRCGAHDWTRYLPGRSVSNGDAVMLPKIEDPKRAPALPKQLDWPATDSSGRPLQRRIENVRALLEYRQQRVRLNSFTGVQEISGRGGNRELNDAELNRIWSSAQSLNLPYTFDTIARLVSVEADRNQYHPVADYLEALEWDRKPRLDTWL